MRRRGAGWVLACWAGMAIAPVSAAPASGWWWQPAEPGRLYAIELQGNEVALTIAAWDEAGRPRWYETAVATLSGDSVDTTLFEPAGGPGLNGDYRAPGAPLALGALRLTFGSDVAAQLTFAGSTTPLEPYRFAVAPVGPCVDPVSDSLLCSGFESADGASTARADPQAGGWRAAAEPARRYFIEAQHGQQLSAAFVFDEAGKPVWYLSGPQPIAAATVALDWNELGDGQALTGAHRPARVVRSNVQSETLVFEPATRARRATLTNATGPARVLQRLAFVPFAGNAYPRCPADPATPLFDTLPLDPADFLAFRPLGFVSFPIHLFPAKHSAFSMTPPGQIAQPKPFRAPARLIVDEILEASFSRTGNRNYQVFAYPCAELRIYIGHLDSLSSVLATAFAAAPVNCQTSSSGDGETRTCRRTGLAVEVAAGEVIGEGPDTAGIDFGVTDFRLAPAGFVRYEHWGYFYHYSTSPLDYFTPALRQTLAAKTGQVFGARFRTTLPIGGEFMQDLPGTAQGNWFRPGTYHATSTDLTSALSLIHDYVDPAQPLLMVGTSIAGLNPGVYAYAPVARGSVNRDFASIRADGRIHCLERFLTGTSPGGLPLGRPSGALLLAVPDAGSLRVELLDVANCPTEAQRAFTTRAVMFER